MRAATRNALILVAGAASACRPDFGAPTSLVADQRVLAIVAEPPEAAPGEAISVRALVVGPEGTIDAPADWSFCLDPEPAADNNVVAASCVTGPATTVGSGVTISAALPGDGCARFGPDTPPTIPGQPPLRPRDADVTGGYYQPLRATVGDPTAGALLAGVALIRISCNLPNVGLAVIQEYQDRYRRNDNPTIQQILVAATDGTTSALPTTLAPGASLVLVVAWPAGDAETFPVYDVRAQALVDRRESLRASWFATAGAFDVDRSGRTGDDPLAYATNTWTAPDAPGPVHFWIVLRDDRGGSATRAFDIDVQ